MTVVAMLPLLCGFDGPPTTQPAEAAASQPAMRRITPLATAVEGDFAVYRTLTGHQRVEVRHATLLLAEVEVRSVLAGRIVGLPAITTLRQTDDYALDLAEREGASVKAGSDVIDAAGRRWRCRRTVARWTRDGVECERRVWMNEVVPVWGVVRMEFWAGQRMTARMELTTFGRGAESTKADKKASPVDGKAGPAGQRKTP